MNQQRIHEGMRVRAPDGELLGKVTAIGDTHFEMEPGLLSMEDYRVPYSTVASIQGSELVLMHGRADLEHVEEDDGSAVPPRHSEHMDDEGLIHAPPAPEPHHP